MWNQFTVSDGRVDMPFFLSGYFKMFIIYAYVYIMYHIQTDANLPHSTLCRCIPLPWGIAPALLIVSKCVTDSFGSPKLSVYYENKCFQEMLCQETPEKMDTSWCKMNDVIVPC